MIVYIFGPFGPDASACEEAASLAAAEISEKGHRPFRPFLDRLPGRGPLQWIEACDGLLRLPGKPWGPPTELWKAKRLGLPIWERSEDIP